MKNLVVRNFPDDLHRSLKVKAAQTDQTLSAMIIEALREYVAKNEGKKGH